MKKRPVMMLVLCMLLSTAIAAYPLSATTTTTTDNGDVTTATTTTTASYEDITLTGGFQSGHFDDIWDLTAGDMVITFTYDAKGLVDDSGGATAHAWAELGVRSVGTSDFNPYGKVYWTKTVDLMAGQNMLVGIVQVCRVENALYVRYLVTEPGWFITETHLAIATSLDNIPQTKKGNPIPGKFPYGMTHDPPTDEYTYVINPVPSTWDPTTKLYIAAHAALIHVVEVCETIISDATAEWSADGTTWNPAFACWVHPLWANVPGATWIWRTELTDPPWEYDNVPEGGWWFRKSFNLPSTAYDITASIVSANGDNAYRIAINGVPLVPDGEGAMNKEGPDLYEWSTVVYHSIPVDTIVPGSNEIQLRALNYFNWGDAYSNPAGLIFKMDLCYKLIDRCETAWGWKTGDFEGANWATYFTYKPTATSPVVEGSGVWLATDYDWTANTFDPDPVGAPVLDIDDKLLLQRMGGNDEGYYNLPSSPSQYWNNYGFWFDRDGVDQWQQLMWGCIDGGTYNTNGLYDVVITLHATSDTTGTAYMTVNGIPQGFYNGPWYDGEPALYRVGTTFSGDLKHLQVFYGLFGYGATHTVSFQGITVTQ